MGNILVEVFAEGKRMSDREVVETFYGRRNKYEVTKSLGGSLSSPSFWIYRNGERFKSAYSSLRSAVETAQKLADKE